MKNFCEKCGAEINQYTGLCPNGCDNEFDEFKNDDQLTQILPSIDIPQVQTPTASPEPVKNKPGKKTLLLIIAAAVLLALLILTVLYFTVFKKTDKTADYYDIAIYSGCDIEEVSKNFDNMRKKTDCADGEKGYTNGSVIIESENGELVDYIEINNECNYKINGVYYGMEIEEATCILKDYGCKEVFTKDELHRIFINSHKDSISLYPVDGKVSGIVLMTNDEASASGGKTTETTTESTSKETTTVKTFSESEPDLGFYRAYSTSTLPPETVNGVTSHYGAENIIDGNPSTAWVEGAAGSGIGERITISSDRPQRINGLIIYNGYCKNRNVYMMNNRVREIRVILGDGTVYTKTLNDGFQNIKNELYFGETVITDSITVEVISVYRGDRFDDTCISEISIIS